MPSATAVSRTCFPLNRSISTLVSAATIIAAAFAISSGVRTFLAPLEPLVSTLISTPISAALAFSESAAI